MFSACSKVLVWNAYKNARLGRMQSLSGRCRAYFQVLGEEAAYAQNGYSLQAWQRLQEMPHSSVETYKGVLTGLCRDVENVTEGCKLLQQAHEQGIQLPIYTYSYFVEQLARGMWISEALDVVVDYSSKYGGVPSIFMCNCVVEGLCKLDRTDEALELLRHRMRDEFKCQPDILTYNSVISALSRSKRMDEVRGLFAEMKQAENCSPDAATYSIYIEGLCRLGKVDEAKLVFRDMLKSGYEPSPVTYNILIHYHCKLGKVLQAEQFLDQMLKQAWAPSSITYTSLVDGHLKVGNLEQALAYFERMISGGLKVSVVLVSLVLDAHSKHNKLLEAVEFLDGLLDACTYPAASSCQYLLKNLFAAGKLDEVLHVLCRITREPDNYSPHELWDILVAGNRSISKQVADRAFHMINNQKYSSPEEGVFLYKVVMDQMVAEGRPGRLEDYPCSSSSCTVLSTSETGRSFNTCHP